MNVTTHLEMLSESDARAFRNVILRLKAQPEAEPSPGLHDRIMAQLHQKRKMPVLLWWAAAAASLAVLFGLAGVLQRALPPGSRHTALAAASGDIRWLAENQEADGTWDPARHGGAETFRPALTALALLALHQEAAAYTGPISKGVTALAALQAADGSFGGNDGQAKLYNLAMATCALATCGGADNPALTHAVTRIKGCQGPDGSWTYTQESNAAVTAWMTRALECAEARGNADAAIPLRKGLRWLRGNVRDDGRIAYHPTSAPSDTLTALSAYSLLAAGKFPDLQTLGRRMTDALTVQPTGVAAPDCYRDYAKIIAFESAGKAASAESVRTQIRQRRSTAAHDQWDIAGGHIYTAALATLCRAQ